ncbi:Rho-type GTPase activating protein Rga1, partial [Coemansia brasiliensis]
LTRVALKGALKAQTEYKCPASIKALLSKLTETSDRQKWALFRLSYQETDIASDLCTTCRSPVETECIEHMRKRKRWHLYCFVCSSCNSEIQHVYPQSALDEAAGTLLCPGCSSKSGVAPGGFKFVSQLEQYSFLMRVALKRLYGLLKMKNAVENPGLARLKKGDIAKELGDLTDLKQIAESPQLSEKEAAAVKEVNREFDSALSQLDKLELQSGTATPVDIDRSKQQQQQPQSQAGGRTPVLPGTTPPVNADMLNAVAKAAVKEAKNEGSLVHVVDAYTDASPPQVLADRRKPRMGHTTVHAVKARMESHKPSSPILQAPGSSQFPLPPMRRASPMASSQLSVSALAAQQQSASGNSSQTPSTLSGKPSKLQRVNDESDLSRTTATSEAETACKVKNMLSRSHTMRFVSDLNTAELFCAKHVAVSRLASLLGQTDISQADL